MLANPPPQIVPPLLAGPELIDGTLPENWNFVPEDDDPWVNMM